MIKFSPTMQNYMRSYALTPEEVVLATLLAVGFSKVESYYLSHDKRDIKKNPSSEYRSLVREKPQILTLADLISKVYVIDDIQDSADGKNKPKRIKTKSKEEDSGEIEDVSTDGKLDKESTLELLQKIAKNPNINPSVTVQAIKTIADIEQYKHQTDNDEEKRVMIYLPLPCKRCKGYKYIKDSK